MSKKAFLCPTLGTLSALLVLSERPAAATLLHLARLDQAATEAALQSRQGVLQGLSLVDQDPGPRPGGWPEPRRTVRDFCSSLQNSNKCRLFRSESSSESRSDWVLNSWNQLLPWRRSRWMPHLLLADLCFVQVEVVGGALWQWC